MKKKLVALLVTLTMLLQVGGTGLTFAEETEAPKITISYTDADGNAHEAVVEGSYSEDGVYVFRDESGSIRASVDKDNSVLTLTVDGKVAAPDSYHAVEVGTHVDATVQGDVVGSVVTYNSGTGEWKEEPQEDGGYIETSTSTMEPSDAKVTIVGNISMPEQTEEGYSQPPAVTATGKSDFTVTGNVDGSIWAGGDSIVTVTGNVTATDEAAIQTNNEITSSVTVEEYDADDNYVQTISSEDNAADSKAVVTVTGSVTSEGTAIRTEGASTVTVNGDVKAGSTYEYETENYNPETQSYENVTITDGSGYGIKSGGYGDPDASTITVNGSLTAEGTAISASDEIESETTRTEGSDGKTLVTETGTTVPNKAVITVNGDVTSNYGSGIWAGSATQVTVNGDLSAYSNAIGTSGGSKVSVTGNVSSEKGSGIVTSRASGGYTTTYEEDKDHNPSNYDYQNADPIEASATVTVGENVTAYSDGVNASGSSKVDVTGDVTAGHEVVSPKWQHDEEKDEFVITGTETSYEGTGISARDSAEVQVGGSVTAESTAIRTWNKYDGDSETTENEDGTTTYVSTTTVEANTAKVNVDGDVTSNHADAIIANGGAEITVGGSVTAEDAAISAYGKASVEVGGDVTAKNGVAIQTTAEANSYTNTRTYDSETGMTISYEYEPGEKTDEAKVVVDGDVTAEKDAAIFMTTGNSTVKVWGDVTGGFIEEEEEEEAGAEPEEPDMEGEGEDYEPTAEDLARDEAYAEAFKDVEFAEEVNRGAIQISLDENNSGELIVGGTVKVNEGSEAVPLVLTYTVDSQEKLAALPEQLPEMKIYEIAPNGGEYFDVNVLLEKEVSYSWVDEETGETKEDSYEDSQFVELSEEDHAAVVEAIAKAIQYIIKLDAVNGTIDLGSDHYDAENDIYTAHEGEDVTVTVRPNDGYELTGLTATGNYTLTQNPDGTWTLVVQRGGGVTISAAIAQRSAPAAPAAPAEADTTPGPVHPAVGKTVVFGRYDVDGDGTAEDLTWRILSVSGGCARMAMFAGMEAIPDDFDTAFNEEETAAITPGSIKELDSGWVKRLFGDDKVHVSLYVKLAAIDY